jgi:hypothetical protein
MTKCTFAELSGFIEELKVLIVVDVFDTVAHGTSKEASSSASKAAAHTPAEASHTSASEEVVVEHVDDPYSSRPRQPEEGPRVLP